MLKKRIIPCLDIKNGRTVKGVNFLELRDAGDPVELAKRYVQQGADELVFLDISATLEKRKTLATLVKSIASEINIPFTVGGGINTIQDVEILIRAGADKISINSAALKYPKFITQIAIEFGIQCVVVAIDIKKVQNEWMVFSKGGSTMTKFKCIEWARHAEQCGAGEILLTSMNNDGAKTGFAIDIIDQVCNIVNIPVIASGGAGDKFHFRDVFQKTAASAALAASVFHFGEISIPQLKNYLAAENVSVR